MLKLVCHVKTQEEQLMIKLAKDSKLDGKKVARNTRGARRKNATSDFRTLNINDAEKSMMDCDKWRQVVWSINTHSGFYRYGDINIIETLLI